jgi:hypothetical protein
LERDNRVLLRGHIHLSSAVKQLQAIAIDTSLNADLALADGLAFQDRAFKISPQYTFEIDCREGLEPDSKAWLADLNSQRPLSNLTTAARFGRKQRRQLPDSVEKLRVARVRGR